MTMKEAKVVASMFNEGERVEKGQLALESLLSPAESPDLTG